MNKNMIWGIVIVLIIVVAGGVFVMNQQSQKAQDEKMAQDNSAMMLDDSTVNGEDKDTVMTEENKMMDNKMASERYVAYSKAALENAAGNRRVLFFYANWCPTCKPADADFIANANRIPSDVTLIRVNYNDTDTDQEEKDLAQQYGITYQHTFVQIDAQGKVVAKWNGGQTNELLANIK